MAQAKKAATTSSNGRTTASIQQNGKLDQRSAATKTSNNNEDNTESMLEKFFLDQLRDIYYAEKQILKALPKMQEACTTEELKDAFGDHLHQTNKHVKRLEKVFKLLEKNAEGKKCEAMDGLIKECEGIIEETQEGSMTRDAAMIMGAQKIEHYEIATYGGLVQLAITIGEHEAADLLDTTLSEEEDTDHLLTGIAESYINMEAEEEKKFRRVRTRGREEAGVQEA